MIELPRMWDFPAVYIADTQPCRSMKVRLILLIFRRKVATNLPRSMAFIALLAAKTLQPAAK